MKNFYSREDGDYVLEEDKTSGSYRWVTLDTKRISSGFMKPESVKVGCEQHLAILDALPHQLSISPLDCETLNLTYGFDYAYSGNQHQLLANALGLGATFDRAQEIPGAQLVSFEPNLQFALVPDCRIQCRISFEPRTTAYHVKTNEFPEENLSVFLTLRKYGSIDPDQTFVSTFEDLMRRGQSIVDDYLMENVLVPLQTAILID